MQSPNAHLDHQGRPHARAGRSRHRLRQRTAYEHRECVYKAKALLRAAEEAVRIVRHGEEGRMSQVEISAAVRAAWLPDIRDNKSCFRGEYRRWSVVRSRWPPS